MHFTSQKCSLDSFLNHLVLWSLYSCLLTLRQDNAEVLDLFSTLLSFFMDIFHFIEYPYVALASLTLKVGGLLSFRNTIILFMMDCYVSIIICLLFGKTLFLLVFSYSLVAGIALKESIYFAAGNGV